MWVGNASSCTAVSAGWGRVSEPSVYMHGVGIGRDAAAYSQAAGLMPLCILTPWWCNALDRHMPTTCRQMVGQTVEGGDQIAKQSDLCFQDFSRSFTVSSNSAYSLGRACQPVSAPSLSRTMQLMQRTSTGRVAARSRTTAVRVQAKVNKKPSDPRVVRGTCFVTRDVRGLLEQQQQFLGALQTASGHPLIALHATLPAEH